MLPVMHSGPQACLRSVFLFYIEDFKIVQRNDGVHRFPKFNALLDSVRTRQGGVGGCGSGLPECGAPYQSPRGQRRACAASPSAVHALLSGMYSIKSPG